MKKLLSLLLMLVIITALVVGCTPAKPVEEPTETPVVEEPVVEEPVVEVSKIAKLGLGQVISIGKSTDKTAEKTATAQADVTIAAVGFDADGKVASVTIDVAQTKVAFDENMMVTSDKTSEVKSKKDLGADYGMVKASAIGKEWFEQMEAFENWMIGKTIAEITGLKVKEVDESHKAVPDVPELTSSVTVSVESYIAAVEEAWNNSVDATGAEKIGLGVETHIGSSKDATADKPATGQVDTYMAASAFDKDGKIVASIIDNAQIKVAYDADGKVTSDKAAVYKTKQELKEEYGMVKASAIGKEWFEQMAAFQEWLVGKTASEVAGLAVKEVNESHKSVPDVPELTSSVTITVEGYQAVVAETAAMAR